MSTATVTSKGQITLPKSVRDRLRLRAGDRVEFVESADGFLVIAARGNLRAVRGILPAPPSPVSVDDMNAAIARMGRP